MENKFALIGQNIKHSLSPFIHNEIFKYTKNFNSSYTLLELAPNEIEKFISYSKIYNGFNVTMPYKTYMYEKIKNIDYNAKMFKSINTITKLKDGSFKGYNTDSYGFLKSLSHFKINLKNNILLLGLGGAGRTIAVTAALYNCKLTVAVREKSIKKTYKILQEIIPEKKLKNIKLVDIKNIPVKNYNITINATPIGMLKNFNNMPITPNLLRYCKNAVDLIYAPKETKFLKIAKKFNIKSINGLYMLLMQAVKSNEIFTGTKIKSDVVTKIYRKLKKIWKIYIYVVLWRLEKQQ